MGKTSIAERLGGALTGCVPVGKGVGGGEGRAGFGVMSLVIAADGLAAAAP